MSPSGASSTTWVVRSIEEAGVDETEAAQGVFHAIKTGITAGWIAAVAVEQCELVRLRNTSTAREKLDAFLSKG